MSAPACLYCNDTGILSTVKTRDGEFRTYCTHCPAGQPQNPPPLPATPVPPTDDILRE